MPDTQVPSLADIIAGPDRPACNRLGPAEARCQRDQGHDQDFCAAVGAEEAPEEPMGIRAVPVTWPYGDEAVRVMRLPVAGREEVPDAVQRECVVPGHIHITSDRPACWAPPAVIYTLDRISHLDELLRMLDLAPNSIPAQVIRFLHVAGEMDRERLRLGYPAEVRAWELWHWHEPLDAADVRATLIHEGYLR